MNVTEMLGLDETAMTAIVERRWSAWVAADERLALVKDPGQLATWRRRVEPGVANRLLLGLAWLAAVEGGNDTEAAQVLAWLALPAVLRVRNSLGLVIDDRLDEVVAAQVWVEVRGLPTDRPYWVMAKIGARLREGVLLECGIPTLHRPQRLASVWMDTFDSEIWATSPFDRDDDAVEVLADLLEWASATEVIDAEDRELLVSLIAAARDLEIQGLVLRDGGVGGLSGREITTVVAQQRGWCSRTVRRRTARCVDALIGASGNFTKVMAG